MRITCHIIPKAKSNKITRINEFTYRITTTAPAEDNKANIAIEKMLAQHLGVKTSDIFLMKGHTIRKKVYDVLLQGTI